MRAFYLIPLLFCWACGGPQGDAVEIILRYPVSLDREVFLERATHMEVTVRTTAGESTHVLPAGEGGRIPLGEEAGRVRIMVKVWVVGRDYPALTGAKSFNRADHEPGVPLRIWIRMKRL